MQKKHSILSTYLRRLTNLAGNNRSIYLPRTGSDQYIDIHTLSQLNGEKSFSIVEALIAEKKKLLCPVVDSRMEASNEASKKLKRLQRLANLVLEERGSKDLHLGWPFVRGKFLDGTAVRGPLLFFPIEIVEDGNQWVVKPREGSEITFNKSLLLAYSFYNRISAEEFLLDETFEDIDRDSTVFRTSLYQLLQKSSIDINFNPDNYRDELIDFQQFTKEEFEAAHKNGELKLHPEAVMGIFPQAGSYLVPDYIEMINGQDIGSLEEFFAAKNHSEQPSLLFSDFTSMVKEEKLLPAFPLDAWQENALKAVKSGYSTVIQGPPGTGKSQLICGLISDAIAMGKRVLVVCQKRAALDVVYARMKEVELADFLALVHDFKADRKDIFEKASKQIDRIDEYKTKNNSLDAIQLERTFLQTCHRITQITEELEEFKKALYNAADAGASAKELYLLSDPSQETINLKQEYQNFGIDQVDEFTGRLNTYAAYAGRFETADHPWRERRSFAAWGVSDLKMLQEILVGIPSFIQSLSHEVKMLLGITLDWTQLKAFLEEEEAALEITQLLSDEQVYGQFLSILNEPDDDTSTLWLSNIQRNVLDCFLNEGPERSIPSPQLGQLQQALYRSMKSRRSLIGLVRWELFSKDKFLIKRALVGNGLESTKAGFKSLEQKLDNRLNIEHNYSKLRAKKWINNLPGTYDETLIKEWFDKWERAIKAKLVFHSIRGLSTLLDPAQHNHLTFRQKISSFFSILASIENEKIKWNRYLTNNQINQVALDPEQADRQLKILGDDFDAICEFDKLKEQLTSDERSVITKLHDKLESWSAEQVVHLFTNSLYLAWIDHLETKFPILRMVSSGKLEMIETELRDLLLKKNKLGNQILLLRVRERIIENLEFNRLNNRVTFRDLHHQLNKKKRLWPVRKVVAEYSEELFRLLPCWLASPESVSAVFPLQTQFDLVIFDEASQCFTERGIPAIYRGKQVVIAGDNQQLKPSDLYRIRWDDESENNPDLEAESLLDLGARYFMQIPLRGHYRSQSIELVDFSNRYFYGGRLQLLPQADLYLQGKPAFEFYRVDGTWDDNTNLTEAERVTELVLELVQSDPENEIGVVTFNIHQQMLIMDLLDAAFAEKGMARPASLIVKNIENVQGDEKDTIIFSVAYAADKKGKLQARFGSLNMAGGENRLNVAITRARKKVVVICSFEPDELHVEETLNPGPKLLKQYLAFAKAAAQGQFKPFVKDSTGHKPNWYLKSKIQDWAKTKFPEFDIEDEIPFSDIAVKALTKGKLILTDDELYFQNPSVKDLHGSQLVVFDQKGWSHHRAFSRNYWSDCDKFFNEVARFIST